MLLLLASKIKLLNYQYLNHIPISSSVEYGSVHNSSP